MEKIGGVGPSSEDDRPRVWSKVRCLRPEPYREGRNEQTQALGCFHTFTLNARKEREDEHAGFLTFSLEEV